MTLITKIFLYYLWNKKDFKSINIHHQDTAYHYTCSYYRHESSGVVCEDLLGFCRDFMYGRALEGSGWDRDRDCIMVCQRTKKRNGKRNWKVKFLVKEYIITQGCSVVVAPPILLSASCSISTRSFLLSFYLASYRTRLALPSLLSIVPQPLLRRSCLCFLSCCNICRIRPQFLGRCRLELRFYHSMYDK